MAVKLKLSLSLALLIAANNSLHIWYGWLNFVLTASLCIQAMAKALASSLEPKSRDWVPLFIAFATVRGGNSFTDAHSPTHTSPDSEADSDLDSDSESDPVTPAQPQSSTPLETTLQPELTQAVKSKVIGSTHKRQQQQGRDGIHVGAKAWRNQLKEWLGFVGGIKGAKGVFRSEELKQCVVKQLQDTDSGVQQAALRSLQVHTYTHAHAHAHTPRRTACLFLHNFACLVKYSPSSDRRTSMFPACSHTNVLDESSTLPVVIQPQASS